MTGEFDPARYWEKRLQANWGLHGVGCIGYGEQFNRAIYQVKAHVFRRAVASIPVNPPDSRVLDVGSGVGFVIDQWLRLGARKIQGADISPFAVAKLGESYPAVRFFQADIGASDFAYPGGGEFDCISALDVLYHIVDDAAYRRALRNLSGLLRAGGYLLLSDNFLHGEALRKTHQVSHSLATLEQWLGEAGFEIIWRRPQYVLLNFPVDSHNRLLHHWWRGLSGFLARHPRAGRLALHALVPLELLLTRLLREGPTTEMAVCRKAG